MLAGIPCRSASSASREKEALSDLLAPGIIGGETAGMGRGHRLSDSRRRTTRVISKVLALVALLYLAGSWHFSGEIYDMPILVFHGTEDETVPMTTSEELKRRVPHVQLVRCAGVGHIECWNLDPKAYESQVRKFLERAL